MSDGAKVSFFKRGKTRPVTARQRSPSSSAVTPSGAVGAGPAIAESEVVIPARKVAAGFLRQGTKRRRLPDEDQDDGEDARASVNVNWAGSTKSSVNAVRGILEDDAAAENLARKRAKVNPEEEEAEAGEEQGAPDDGLYKGQAAYKNRIDKSRDVPKGMRVGPQRMSGGTIRTVTIVDYQPDVCKDYKETGFCGFGDTCKFLHDRGTYMAGWQLDKMYEADTAKGNRAEADDEASDSDEDVPFACLICRKPFTDPVVTRCGHYYCSACAIKRFAKTPKCLACGVPTGGIFNRAEKVVKKMKEKAEAEAVEGISDEQG